MTGEIHILLGLTGSVASIKARNIVDELNKVTFGESTEVKVKVIATESAKHFLEREDDIGDDGSADEAIEILDDAKEWNSWQKRGDPVLHIDLVKWADILLIAPCDALTLSKLANGHCDNLLTCVAQAWDFASKKAIVICPSMNTKMWEHPATQKNLKTVFSYGVQVIPPISKTLMCGDTGIGPMEEPVKIAKAVKEILEDQTETKCRLSSHMSLMVAFGVIVLLLSRYGIKK